MMTSSLSPWAESRVESSIGVPRHSYSTASARRVKSLRGVAALSAGRRGQLSFLRLQFAPENGCRSGGHVSLDGDLACTGPHLRGVVPGLHPQQHIHAHAKSLFDA